MCNRFPGLAARQQLLKVVLLCIVGFVFRPGKQVATWFVQHMGQQHLGIETGRVGVQRGAGRGQQTGNGGGLTRFAH